MPVEHHADGDKKQPQQHIVKRSNVGAHLVAVFSLRHQHARDKRAQRQAQAGQLSQPRQAQRDQQQIQHEQLFALAPRYQCQPPAHHALTAGQQYGDQNSGFEQRPAQRAQQLVGRRTQRWNQHQERHHRQVLEQQDAQNAPTMLGFQLGALGH